MASDDREPSVPYPSRHPRFDTAALRLDAAVFAGGVTGALLRVALVRAVPVHAGEWPWPTFAANLVGTAALGYLTTRLQERLPPSTFRRPLLGTGLCGALTTFSTLQIEVIRLARDGNAVLAGAYVLASLAAGLALTVVATGLTRRARLQ